MSTSKSDMISLFVLDIFQVYSAAMLAYISTTRSGWTPDSGHRGISRHSSAEEKEEVYDYVI